MSSGVLDGDFYSHPKAIHAWGLHHSAIGIWALAVSYAHEHSNGGIVSLAFVKERLPAKREREAVIAALTSVAPGEKNPLWSPVDGGWQIHNFGKRAAFMTQEQATELSRKRSEAGSKGAASRWQEDSNLPDGKMASAISDKEREELQALKERPELLSLSKRLAMAICQNDPKAHVAPESKRWLNAIRLLIDRDGRSVPEVEKVIDWCQADEFWKGNILSAESLRSKFTQLAMRAQSPARAPSPLAAQDAAALAAVVA